MLLGGTSFAVLHRTLTRGLPWGENVELRAYVAVFGIATLIIAVNLRTGMPDEFATNQAALDHAAFQAATILTTTGFVSHDYTLWPAGAQAVLLVMFFMGGGMAGSTVGGIKMIRLVLFVRMGFSQFFSLIHPRAVTRIKLGDQPVEDAVLSSVASFMALWISLLILGALLFTFFGFDLWTAVSAAGATLGNVGPGFAGVGPSHTWQPFSDGAKLVASLWMILGRLELYTILVILTPGFWRF